MGREKNPSTEGGYFSLEVGATSYAWRPGHRTGHTRPPVLCFFSRFSRVSYLSASLGSTSLSRFSGALVGFYYVSD
jgi:hypothetical protein